MKTIHLRDLNFEVSVPDNVYYFDEGSVSTIEGQANFLNWKYSGNFKSPGELRNNLLGSVYFATVGNSYNFHKYVVSDLNILERTLVGGHEETHFLHAVRRLDALSAEIRKKVGVEIDFHALANNIRDTYIRKETIAEIGGIYAVHNSFGEEALTNPGIKYSSAVGANQAREIYLGALKKSRNLASEKAKTSYSLISMIGRKVSYLINNISAKK